MFGLSLVGLRPFWLTWTWFKWCFVQSKTWFRPCLIKSNPCFTLGSESDLDLSCNPGYFWFRSSYLVIFLCLDCVCSDIILVETLFKSNESLVLDLKLDKTNVVMVLSNFSPGLDLVQLSLALWCSLDLDIILIKFCLNHLLGFALK